MPDYTFTTDAEDEAALARWIQKHQEPDGSNITVAQALRRIVRHWLRALIEDYREERRTEMREAYEAASPADKAAMDLILDKYR
jgi:hypothetical protein